MKFNKILAWVVAVSGILLLPSIVISYPSYLSVPFNILLGIFIASLLLFVAIETITKKQYLILSLIVLVGVIFLFGLISSI
ncbi:MAG: hypothetical protein V4697_01000 [Patescibacteria group bacterium]